VSRFNSLNMVYKIMNLHIKIGRSELRTTRAEMPKCRGRSRTPLLPSACAKSPRHRLGYTLGIAILVLGGIIPPFSQTWFRNSAATRDDHRGFPSAHFCSKRLAFSISVPARELSYAGPTCHQRSQAGTFSPNFRHFNYNIPVREHGAPYYGQRRNRG
jgi:hypothetical protein